MAGLWATAAALVVVAAWGQLGSLAGVATTAFAGAVFAATSFPSAPSAPRRAARFAAAVTACVGLGSLPWFGQDLAAFLTLPLHLGVVITLVHLADCWQARLADPAPALAGNWRHVRDKGRWLAGAAVAFWLLAMLADVLPFLAVPAGILGFGAGIFGLLWGVFTLGMLTRTARWAPGSQEPRDGTVVLGLAVLLVLAVLAASRFS